MKAFTDINQSKKLAEILPIESADMWWLYYYDIISDIGEYDKEPMLHKPVCDPDKAFPCWSLAALLDQLEDTIYDDDGNEHELVIKKEGVQYDIYYLDVYGEQEYIELDYFYYDLIDCCYEMILKLHEQKLI